MMAIALLGIVFSICTLAVTKPLLAYKRLEFELIFFLEVLHLICFILLFTGEALR